jgi:hypothetical protein
VADNIKGSANGDIQAGTPFAGGDGSDPALPTDKVSATPMWSFMVVAVTDTFPRPGKVRNPIDYTGSAKNNVAEDDEADSAEAVKKKKSKLLG